jgi:hypothetical protein
VRSEGLAGSTSSGSSSSGKSGDGGADGAKWVFPDKRDKKEISVETSSENAEGKERKEVFKFGFDRVTSSALFLMLLAKANFGSGI